MENVPKQREAIIKDEKLVGRGTCENNHDGKLIDPEHDKHDHAHDHVMRQGGSYIR